MDLDTVPWLALRMHQKCLSLIINTQMPKKARFILYQKKSQANVCYIRMEWSWQDNVQWQGQESLYKKGEFENRKGYCNTDININHFEDEGSRGENDDLRIFYIELSWLKNHMKECHLPYGRKEMSQFTQNDFVREKCWR